MSDLHYYYVMMKGDPLDYGFAVRGALKEVRAGLGFGLAVDEDPLGYCGDCSLDAGFRFGVEWNHPLLVVPGAQG